MTPTLLGALVALAAVLVLVLVRLRRAEPDVVGLDGLDESATPTQPPVPRLVPVPPTPDPAWSAASRTLAAAGRPERAALARWAADLDVLAPLLAGRHAELVGLLADLPRGADAADTLALARAAALSLLDPARPVAPVLPPADHLRSTTDHPAPTPTQAVGSRRSAVVGDRGALLDLAAHWSARADAAAAEGELGLERREAELATYDAFLVGLAERHGSAGTTVAAALGDVARSLVADLDEPAAGTSPEDDAALVRDLLAPLLPVSERPAYLALARPVALAVGY